MTATQLYAVELSGSDKLLLFRHKDSLQRNVFSDLNRVRLTADGGVGAWQWRLSYDNELLYGGIVRDPAFRLYRRLPEPTWLDLQANIRHNTSLDWQHKLYRGWLQYQDDTWQVILGRQRIAWGSGRIWNPTDRFNPVLPTALEPDQKLGVDAASVTYTYSDFGSVQGLATPGRATHAVRRKWAVRWQDTFRQTDLALWLGEIGDERVLAGDITGNIGDATARLEWQQSWHGQQGDFGQFVVGIDGTVNHALFPAGLYLAAEYFYNGLPQASTLRFVQADVLQSNSRQLLGILAGYDITPLWRAELVYLMDMEKTSRFFSPGLQWSASEHMDVKVFAQLPSGSVAGAFAGLHDVFALTLEYYF